LYETNPKKESLVKKKVPAVSDQKQSRVPQESRLRGGGQRGEKNDVCAARTGALGYIKGGGGKENH